MIPESLSLSNLKFRLPVVNPCFILISIFALLSGCSSESQTAPASQPANTTQQAQPAQSSTPRATVSPSQSMDPKQAAKRSQDNIPEIMRRPLTREEMEKALEKMPPEVRARIQGLGVAPPGARPKPSPTPTPKKSPKR
jgi:uncharacterized lipoprotein YajG